MFGLLWGAALRAAAACRGPLPPHPAQPSAAGAVLHSTRTVRCPPPTNPPPRRASAPRSCGTWALASWRRAWRRRASCEPPRCPPRHLRGTQAPAAAARACDAPPALACLPHTRVSARVQSGKELPGGRCSSLATAARVRPHTWRPHRRGAGTTTQERRRASGRASVQCVNQSGDSGRRPGARSAAPSGALSPRLTGRAHRASRHHERLKLAAAAACWKPRVRLHAAPTHAPLLAR